MKLHLPLGLLAALAATWLAPTVNAASKKFTDTKTFRKSDWEKNGSDYNFKLDLGLTLKGTDASWVISFKIPTATTSSLGSQVDSTGMPKELKGREGDFYFYFDPFTDGGIIYLGGFGWLTGNTDLNFQVNATNGQFSMSKDRFDIVNNPTGALSDFPKTTSPEIRFMTRGGSGKGLDNYTGGTYSQGWETEPSITTLYANGQRFDIQITYMTPLEQIENVYTLAGAGELGQYEEGGKGTGLLSTYGDDMSVLNTDLGSWVDDMYGSDSDGTRKLRFVGAGQMTKAGEGDSEDTYQDITTGAGGAVTTDLSLKMSGVIVEQGATDYKLTTSKNITWENRSDFQIGEDFTVKAEGGFVWGGDATFEIEEDKTLTLDGTGSGSGKMSFTGFGAVEVSDAGDHATLGTGEIVLNYATKESSETAPPRIGGVTLDLGNKDLTNKITISGAGNLANAGGKTDGSVTLSDIRTDVDLGGLKADRITGVSAYYGSAFHVKNIGAGTLNLSSSMTGTFSLDDTFFSRSENDTNARYMFEFDMSSSAEGSTYVVQLGEQRMNFNLSDSVLKNCEGTAYFWFTNGRLEGIDISSPEAMTKWLEEHFNFTIQGTDAGDVIQFFVEGSEESKDHGKIKMLISNDSIWYASKHGDGSDLLKRTDLIEKENWKQIVIDRDTTIDIAKDTDGTLNLKNLRTGDDGTSGKLTIKNSDDSEKTLTLDYEAKYALGADGEPIEDEEGNKQEVSWIFDNDMELQGKTSLEKEGKGWLTVTGNLTVEDGDLTVNEGKLTLAGDQNRAGKLVLGNDATAATLEMDGGTLTLEGAEEEMVIENGIGNSISGSGVIELNDTKMRVAAKVIATENQLVIRTNGSKSQFTTGGAVSLAGIEGTPNKEGEDGGTISLGGDLTITGDGTLHSFEGKLESSGAKIIAKGDQTGQSITSAGNANIGLEILDDAYVELYGAGDINPETHLKEATYKSLTVGGQKEDGTPTPGTLYVSPTGVGEDVEVGTHLDIQGDVSFGAGSYTEFAYNFAGVGDKLSTEDVGALLTSTGSITIDKGAKFALNNAGSMFDIHDHEALDHFVIMDGKGGVNYTGEGADLTDLFDMRGAFLVYYKNAKVEIDGNTVVISADVNRDNVFTAAGEGSDNVAAGADLIWAARYSDTALNTDSELYRAMSGIAYALSSNPKEAAKALAAVAGSTVPIMGTAQRNAMRNQLTRMRNHAVLMGLNEDYTYTELPFVHFWVEANGDFNKLDDSDGYESGYSYNAWGGTMGLEMDVDETTSVAAGITALYGDIDGGVADLADGKLDSYYLSVMGRFQRKRWGHTVVGVVGLNEAKLNRTVSYSGGSYNTHGSTDGYSAGLMYEATYDIPMDLDGTSVVQPLLNFSVMKTTLKGYSESGQDGQGVGLNVGDQDWVTATVGLGVRWIGTVGESGFNRSAQVEVRANIAQDLGDSQGEAAVALQANPSVSRNVKAAEVGKTALQVGASLRVPVNEQTQLYFNADADFRDAMTSWNLGVGMRYDF